VIKLGSKPGRVGLHHLQFALLLLTWPLGHLRIFVMNEAPLTRARKARIVGFVLLYLFFLAVSLL
jgi:hypothetical protein